jgi:hypothetical protein
MLRMSDYNTAWSTLGNAIGAVKGQSSGSIDDVGHLSPDQQIEVAKVAALLSIAQELSAIRADGIGRDYIEE